MVWLVLPKADSPHTEVAQVCFENKLTQNLVSDETIRTTLKRRGVNWKRARNWISSPDPAYVRKKGTGSFDPPGGHAARPGPGLCG